MKYIIKFIAIAMVVLLSIELEAEMVLNEPLNGKLLKGVFSKNMEHSFVKNRTGKAMGALEIREGKARWNTIQAGKKGFIEFWMKPEKWDAKTKASVVLATFRKGDSLYKLVKIKSTPSIELQVDGETTRTYPIYNWSKQPWMGSSKWRDMWHYVHIPYYENGIDLNIDGFPAKKVTDKYISGTLNDLCLLGIPGTVFADLHIISGNPLESERIRKRYKCLYRGQPDIPKNTVTCPILKSPPKIDGKIDDGEWTTAATLGPLVRLRSGGAYLTTGIQIQLGYDQKYLYMSFKTSYEGNLRGKYWKKRDMKIWSEESYEIFLHPPFTGVPDFCQLVGNPFGDQADLKMLDLKWNGAWNWETVREDGVWTAEFRADFSGIGTPPPGDKATWSMNIFNSFATAGWCDSQAYNNHASFGSLKFDATAPSIRPGNYLIEGNKAKISIQVGNANSKNEITTRLDMFKPGDVLPSQSTKKQTTVTKGKMSNIDLFLDLDGTETGRLVLSVVSEDVLLFCNHVRFPGKSSPVRTGFPKKKTVANKASAKIKTKKETISSKRWSAEELGQTLLRKAEWENNDLGVSDDVPKPWTPMTINGQTVQCWGRNYIYDDSPFPVQITSLDKKLLTGPIQLIIESDGQKHVFGKAKLDVKQVNDSLVKVNAVAEDGPFKLTVLTEYEFDGMGKVELLLECPNEKVTVDTAKLTVPLKSDRAKFYHVTSSQSGHAPYSTSDKIPKKGLVLDGLREVVWLGDDRLGLCWFTEDMKDWRIKDEKGIETISVDKNNTRRFTVKLADKPFRLENDWRLVFGFQATPMKPFPKDHLKRSNYDAIAWRWFWGDGQYYPFHDYNHEGAKKEIFTQRSAGHEVMPCSSLRYFGVYRFAKSRFGDITKPGMAIPEVMLWKRQWDIRRPLEKDIQTIPAEHAAKGDWEGKKYEPHGLVNLSPASPFQDWYVWKLKKLIDDTGLGAIYLDQPLITDDNPCHGCGYVNYAGKWVHSAPIFETRRMLKRIHRLFYDKHGKTLIKYHCSNQIIPPIMSFADIFWDGENYLYGPHSVAEFYSELLSPERMRAQHSGRQFGFAADLLPELSKAKAPTPASTIDMLGWFLIHGSTCQPLHTPNNALTKQIHDVLLKRKPETMEVIRYYDKDNRVRVEPETVKYALYHKPGTAMLLLFNRNDEIVEAKIKLDLAGLRLTDEKLNMTDIINNNPLNSNAGNINIAILPRDFRIIEIAQKRALNQQ